MHERQSHCLEGREKASCLSLYVRRDCRGVGFGMRVNGLAILLGSQRRAERKNINTMQVFN